MMAEEFEAHWSRLSFELRRDILNAALSEICREVGLNKPPLTFEPGSGFAGYDADGNELWLHGTTDVRPPYEITIQYESRIPLEGERELLDDPWEVLNTLYHEFVHYSLLATGVDEAKLFNVRPGDHAWEVFVLADKYANQFYDDVERGRRSAREHFRLRPIEGEFDDRNSAARPVTQRPDAPPSYHRSTDPTDPGIDRPMIDHATPITTLPFGPFGAPLDEGGRSSAAHEMQRRAEEGFERLRKQREDTPPPPSPHSATGGILDLGGSRHGPPGPHVFPGDLSGGGSGYGLPSPAPEQHRPPDPPLEPIPRPEHPPHHHHPATGPRPSEPPPEPIGNVS